MLLFGPLASRCFDGSFDGNRMTVVPLRQENKMIEIRFDFLPRQHIPFYLHLVCPRSLKVNGKPESATSIYYVVWEETGLSPSRHHLRQ